MNKKYTVVTSFPVSLWDTYGEKFLNSFIERLRDMNFPRQMID